MKQITLLYSCYVRSSRIYLRVEHWLVADYPMTMTPLECIEEFCESVGWRFLHGYGTGFGPESYYEFSFERPRGEKVSSTISKAYHAYERVEGAVF